MKTLIAAIEFGSANIIAIAAHRTESGDIEICAQESEDSNGCVRHGYITNIEEAAAKAKHIIQKLNNRLGNQSISKVYVGISGISVRTILHRPVMHLGENVEITTDVLKSLKKQSLNVPLQGYDVLDAVTTQYDLDGHITKDPIGTCCNDLTAYHQLIIGKQHLKRSITAALDRAKIGIAGYIALPIATAQILTSEEMAKGCVLVDFGATTTTVSVYKGGLQRLVVIPLGSDTVTRDIMSKSLRHDLAENAKIKWSSAYAESEDNEPRPSKTETEAIGMDITTLNNIVQCRYEEIILNIKNQIEIIFPSYSTQLEAGIIITGGASMQKGLLALLEQQFPGMTVRSRSFNKYNFESLEKKPRYTAVLGMLSGCIDDCEYHKPVVIETGPAETPKQVSPISTPRPTTTTQGSGSQPSGNQSGNTNDVQSGSDSGTSNQPQGNDGTAGTNGNGNGNSGSNGNNGNSGINKPKNPFKGFFEDLLFGNDD